MFTAEDEPDEIEKEDGHNIVHSDNDDIDSIVNEEEMENDPFVPGYEGDSPDEEFIQDPEQEELRITEEQERWEEGSEGGFQSESEIESEKTNQSYNGLYRTRVSPVLSRKAIIISAVYFI